MGVSQHRIGAAAEQLIAAHLIGRGHDVFFPAMTQSRVDLIYTNGSDARRVQVKTACRYKTGQFEYEKVNLISAKPDRWATNKPYNSDEIDELWVLGTHLWNIPVNLVAGRRTMALGSNNPNYQNRRDYETDRHIVLRGGWDSPVRSVLGLGG